MTWQALPRINQSSIIFFIKQQMQLCNITLTGITVKLLLANNTM